MPQQTEVRNHGSFSESESCSIHEKQVTESCCVQNFWNFREFESWKQEMTTLFSHNFQMFPAVVRHREVYSIVRKIYGRSPTDDLNDLDVNTAVWSTFMNVTLQAAVHLGRDYKEIFTIYQESTPEELFQVTEKLIEGQKEINNLTTIDYKEFTRRSTSLLCDKAFEITNAQTCVFADSLLCLGSTSDQPVEAWKKKVDGIWRIAISKI